MTKALMMDGQEKESRLIEYLKSLGVVLDNFSVWGHNHSVYVDSADRFHQIAQLTDIREISRNMHFTIEVRREGSPREYWSFSLTTGEIHNFLDKYKDKYKIE